MPTGDTIGVRERFAADTLAVQTFTSEDTTTNAVTDILRLNHRTTGTPAIGLAASLSFGLESSTTIDVLAANIEAAWTTVTHATRTSSLIFRTVVSGTTTEFLRLDGANSQVYIANGPLRINRTFSAGQLYLAIATAQTGSLAFSVEVNGGGGAVVLQAGASASSQMEINATGYLNLQAGGADLVSINDTANANMTVGLNINQGANDDEILAFKSSDVAHGVTDFTETDTYGLFKKNEAATGGLQIGGINAGAGAHGILISGVAGTPSTAKTTGASGVVWLEASKISGTSRVAPGLDENLVVIGSIAATRFIFDNEGSAHADVEWVLFASHDDLALVTEVEAVLLARESPSQTSRRQALERAGIIGTGSWHLEDGRPRAMVNFTRLAMLHHGALIQVASRFEQAETRLEALERRNRELETEVQYLKLALENRQN